MTGELKDRLFETGRLVLVSFAQIAFTQKPLQGVLVFLTIFLLAPFSALGAVIGAFVSVVWGTRFGQSVEDRHSGQAGVDTIILGILWGGALAQDLSMDWLFALALMACLSLQAPVGRLMAKLALPPLAVSALLIAWISHGVFKTFSAHFWNHPGLLPFGNWGIVAAICLIAVAFFWRSWRGALLCAVAVVVAAFGSGWALTELGAIGPAGLWAFSVAPAAFGVAGGYLSGTPLGLKGGVFAAALAAVVWLGWVFSPLALVLPPLLAPVFLGIWGALWLVLGAERSAVLNVPLMKTVDLIRSTKAQGGKVTVLSGAGISTASGIPDYTSGAWLPLGVLVTDYNFANFVSSDRCRNLYWDACAHFYSVVSGAQANAGHRALAALESRGWVDSIVTQNVDSLHQKAHSRKVVELHGTLDHVHCLKCAWKGEWPKPPAQITCPKCGGLVKPAVIAMGENIQPAVWAEAWSQLKGSALVIVVGSQLAITSTSALVADARRNNAHFVFLTLGVVDVPVFKDDIFLAMNSEEALPQIAKLLG